jgi:general secretion pathway protein G
MQAKRGFTLVEILIVVVILGILAAIVIPQFTQASTEAKENSLCSDLQSLRSQIELYKCQHNDIAPGNTIADGAGTPAIDSFLPQMIYVTDVNGVDNGTKLRDKPPATRYTLGPYLETVPENPFNKKSNVGLCDARPDAGSGTYGWVYNPETGEIFADDTFKTAAGVEHSQL